MLICFPPSAIPPSAMLCPKTGGRNTTANAEQNHMPCLPTFNSITERISIDNLPTDALTQVLGHCPDLDTVRNLASTSAALRISIYHQNLSCDSCKSPFFADDSLKASPHTKAFSCSVCHQRFCGFTLFDYDRRKCKPQVCDGCGAIECSKCMEAHTTDEEADGYGTENYCAVCQENYEFGMGGC